MAEFKDFLKMLSRSVRKKRETERESADSKMIRMKRKINLYFTRASSFMDCLNEVDLIKICIMMFSSTKEEKFISKLH